MAIDPDCRRRINPMSRIAAMIAASSLALTHLCGCSAKPDARGQSSAKPNPHARAKAKAEAAKRNWEGRNEALGEINKVRGMSRIDDKSPDWPVVSAKLQVTLISDAGMEKLAR